jgi:hypothetical protein
MQTKALFYFLFSLILVGCGGDGGGGTPGPATPEYAIGIEVSGLTGTGLVLQNNGGDNLSVAANGSNQFAGKLPSGSAYAVTIMSQPSGYTCSVTNASGTVSTADISNISVACAPTGVWLQPASAIAAGSTVWNGAWYTGSPSYAIDGNSLTKWTYNGLGSITFDLGTSRTIKGVDVS